MKTYRCDTCKRTVETDEDIAGNACGCSEGGSFELVSEDELEPVDTIEMAARWKW